MAPLSVIDRTVIDLAMVREPSDMSSHRARGRDGAVHEAVPSRPPAIGGLADDDRIRPATHFQSKRLYGPRRSTGKCPSTILIVSI